MTQFVLIIFTVFLGQSLFHSQNSHAQAIVGYTFTGVDQKETVFDLALTPFVTDGCTKYHNGTSENPNLWLHCCIEHDMAYWLGGTSDERKTADQKLYQCVKDTGQPSEARIMYLGTRAGGGPLGQNTYRWGFGWNRVRDYKELSSREKQMAYDMYGENLENLKKDIQENKFTVKVPQSYEYVSPFPYSFCEEEIINYLSPKLSKVTKVTKFRDFQVGSIYTIAIGIDLCDEGLEFQFTSNTDPKTCKQDFAYHKTINKLDDVRISNKCLRKIREK
jgi:hypothetical protein